MRPLIAALSTVAGMALAAGAAAAPWPAKAPVFDHIVIVVEENKHADQIDRNPNASFLNELAATGATFGRMFAEEHNSEGNYFWLFSGSNQGVGFKDVIPAQPFDTDNLGQRLMASGRSFKGYAEDLPSIGSTAHSAPALCIDCRYARKHVPWVSFANLPQATVNLRFADFPTDFTTLPTVAIVVPNLDNDMHDGATLQRRIAAGDAWLRAKLKPYADWAKDHNSLLIVTFDESDDGDDALGLTDPGSDIPARRNRIFTVFAGAHIRPGRYDEGRGITHVNILRTIEAMYGLPKSGRQQALAAAAGIDDDAIVTDVFDPVP